MSFIVQIRSKCGQGERGSKKSKNFADVINGCSPVTMTLRGDVTNKVLSREPERREGASEQSSPIDLWPSAIRSGLPRPLPFDSIVSLAEREDEEGMRRRRRLRKLKSGRERHKEPPDMMSASDGEGGYGKAICSKGGCVDFT